MPDLIEDLFAFLNVSGGKKDQTNNSSCPVCGSELEYDEDQNEIKCPDCDWTNCIIGNELQESEFLY